MIKIFYNNRVLILSQSFVNDNSITKINVSDKVSVKNLINIFLDEEKYDCINIFGEDENILLDEVSKYFSLIRASGGVVANDKKEILFIKRLGFWDLPKGKIENEESPEQASIREVCEECGINEANLKLVHFLKNTYHIYSHNSKYVLKETFWFEMYFNAHYGLKPQLEEDITQVEWVDFRNINSFIDRTYPSIEELLNYYQYLLSQTQ